MQNEIRPPEVRDGNPNVMNIYNSGVTALAKGNYREAYTLFKKAADSEYVSAYFNLAMLIGSGKLPSIDIDYAANCWYIAAELGHQEAKSKLVFLEKADSGLFGTQAFELWAERMVVNGMPHPYILIAACRYYYKICDAFDVTEPFIASELGRASQSNFEFERRFASRTMLSEVTYSHKEPHPTEGHPLEQILLGLEQLDSGLRKGGVQHQNRLFVRATIVAYIVSKFIPRDITKDILLGTDDFFKESQSMDIGSDDEFTSPFEPIPELQSEEGVRSYMLKLSRFNHSKVCIEFSNVMSAKYNLMSVPTGLNDFQKVQTLVTDLTDKALAICIFSFGQDTILSYCGRNLGIFNELINETDKIVVGLDLDPEHHGEQLLDRLRKHLNL